MALRNQPYLPLYVNDVLTDEELMECSAKAHGVYFRLLCIMHKQKTYGSIKLKAKYKQNASKVKGFALMLVKPMPFSVEEIVESLNELIDEGVLYIEDDEYLSQKRMVKDGELSLKRAEAGSKGGSVKKQIGSKEVPKGVATSINESININEDVINKEINVPFSEFWELYNYKKNPEECKKLWLGEKKTKHGLLFNDEVRKTIMDYLPLFIQRTFKSHYPPRPYPHSFLFQHQWLDEIPEVQTSSSLGSRRTSAPQEGEAKYADL